MNSSTFFVLFLGLILISQSSLSANARGLGARGGEGLVDELCNNNFRPKYLEDGNMTALCHEILESNPEAMKAQNYQQLSWAVITMAINKAHEGQNILKGLAASTKSKTLKECVNFEYDNVIYYFTSSLAKISKIPKQESSVKIIQNAVESAQMDVDMAGSFSGECVDGLMKEKRIVSSAKLGADYPQVTALDREIRLLMQMTFTATYKLIP